MGGVFALPHEVHIVRLIFDRRPWGFGERRFGGVVLPHGCHLTRLLLRSGQLLRASGGDLCHGQQIYFWPQVVAMRDINVVGFAQEYDFSLFHKERPGLPLLEYGGALPVSGSFVAIYIDGALIGRKCMAK